MNALGIDVRGLDLDAFFRAGRYVYLAAYLALLLALARSRRGAWRWGPLSLSLLVWALTTFPLQRPYGLQAPSSDRLRHVWWAATAAAGNPPWESGIVGQRTLEPLWSLFVSLVTLRDPSRVLSVYAFLPALGLVATAAALAWAFRASALRATLIAFFVLLASTQPLDYLEPFRIFWARHFLLKPNHALGLALVPVAAAVLARPLTAARAVAAALLLGLLGWVFVVDWALLCAGIACYVLLAAARRSSALGRREVVRLGAAVFASALLVAPFVLYLARHFPNAVSLSAGDNAAAPTLSPWGDARPEAHSLLFLATFDLGPHFPLAVYGAWLAWRRGRRPDLVWLGLLTAAYLAWAVTSVLYAMARARAADEVYWFLAFVVAVHAGLGAHAIVRRAAAGLRRTPYRSVLGAPRVAALGLLAWLPFTVGWFWDPVRTDGHFTAALAPVPDEMRALAAWLRARTDGQDVVFAGGEAQAWVPALTGRRVLRADPQAAAPDPAVLRAQGVRVIVSESPPHAAEPSPPVATVVEVFRTAGVRAYLLGP